MRNLITRGHKAINEELLQGFLAEVLEGYYGEVLITPLEVSVFFSKAVEMDLKVLTAFAGGFTLDVSANPEALERRALEKFIKRVAN
jgi:hypothetical protein